MLEDPLFFSHDGKNLGICVGHSPDADWGHIPDGKTDLIIGAARKIGDCGGICFEK